MLNKDIKVSISSKNTIEVENISIYKYEKCYIKCTDEFGKVIISKDFEINPNSKIQIESDKEISDSLIFTEVFNHDRLIFKKTLNDVCIITFSKKTDNKKTDDLISNIYKISNFDIIKFSLNYEEESKYCKTIKVDYDGELILSSILLKSLESNYRRFVYVNNNLVIQNIDFINLFSYMNSLPIFNHIEEYFIGPQLVRQMNLSDDSSELDTNVILYDKSHEWIFKDVLSKSESSDIENILLTEVVSENILFSSIINLNKVSSLKSKMIEFVEDSKSFNKLFLSNQNVSKNINYNCSFIYCNDQTISRVSKNVITKKFEDKLINFYKDISFSDNRKKDKIQIASHCVGGAFVEINTDSSREFELMFLDGDGKIIHETNIRGNMWTRLNHKFYHKYSVIIKENNQVIYQNKLDLKGKRVYIAIESSSLGDSLAWFPYAEEFRKKHECDLIVSTFNNSFFIENYPNITFITPGEQVINLTAMYSIGWFYNENGDVDYCKCPSDFRDQPLQKTASDILGLDFNEIRPIISYPKVEKKKKVGIAIHGTAQSKYWNNTDGWQKVTDFLTQLGYEVVLYSKEEEGYMGNQHPKGITKFPSGPISTLIDDLSSCEFFIGIGSGLSWLAWSLNLPIVLISGFSKEFTETTSNTWRVINNNVCTGCFNTHRLNASDWNWCPVNQNTEKQFECTKSITSEMVIDKIKDLVSKIN